MGFPVFHGGIGPLDSKGRGVVAEIDVRIECAGVPVESRDLVVGDADGVVIVPGAIQEQVISRALAKVESEHATRGALERGDKLADVFERFGIL